VGGGQDTHLQPFLHIDIVFGLVNWLGDLGRGLRITASALAGLESWPDRPAPHRHLLWRFRGCHCGLDVPRPSDNTARTFTRAWVACERVRASVQRTDEHENETLAKGLTSVQGKRGVGGEDSEWG
jgi:hypothetical protein